MRRRIWLWLTVCACVVSAPRAFAHPVPFTYLDLRVQAGVIDASVVMHSFDLGHDLKIDPPDRLMDPAVAGSHLAEIAALLAGRITISANGRALVAPWTDVEVLPDRLSLRVHARYTLTAPPAIVTIDGQLFPYDPAHQTFVNVYDAGALTQAILDRSRARFDYFTGTRQGAMAVVTKFVPAGVHHILIGPDHILFLIGLLLLGGPIRRLALIVTGFTIAHSITLSLAALNILSPPSRLIEPAIALSIIYVGVDNLLVRQGRDARVWIAFAFGFIHGFGFASVLKEMDLPARALGWSLFAFNLGVEIGQLAVVLVVASALALLRARNPSAARRLAFAGSLVVVAIGAYWFVQRVVFPGGS